MIFRAESERRISAPEDTPFGCRIHAAAEAYGMELPFARFYEHSGGASLFLLDGGAVLEESGLSDADFVELREFLRHSGAESLLCSEEAMRKLGFPVAFRGEIMELSGRPENHPACAVVTSAPAREIYHLLCACRTATFMPPEFEPFYLDFSHRMRHGQMLFSGVRQGGKLAACAFCTAITPGAAFISAVACLPEFRRRGLAQSALAALISRLENRKIFLQRADGENEAFYHGCGFRACGRWASSEASRRGESSAGKDDSRDEKI